MKKGYKSLVSAVLAVIMIFAACVPAFAASESNARANKNEGIKVRVLTQLQDYYAEGSVIEISASFKNNSDKARDIELKVSSTAFMKLESINGNKKFSKTIVFKNVKPGEEKVVTVKGVAKRTMKLDSYYLDTNYSLFLGKYTVWLYRINALVKNNVATAHFLFGDSAAAVMFTANDVTPEPETETQPEPETAAPEVAA